MQWSLRPSGDARSTMQIRKSPSIRGTWKRQLTLAPLGLRSSKEKSESSIPVVLDSGREAVGKPGPIPVGIFSFPLVLLKHLKEKVLRLQATVKRIFL